MTDEQRKIATVALRALIVECEFAVSIFDGKEWVCRNARDVGAVMECLDRQPREMLACRKPDQQDRFIHLNWRAGAHRFIEDYSVSLQVIIEDALALEEAFALIERTVAA